MKITKRMVLVSRETPYHNRFTRMLVDRISGEEVIGQTKSGTDDGCLSKRELAVHFLTPGKFDREAMRAILHWAEEGDCLPFTATVQLENQPT